MFTRAALSKFSAGERRDDGEYGTRYLVLEPGERLESSEL